MLDKSFFCSCMLVIMCGHCLRIDASNNVREQISDKQIINDLYYGLQTEDYEEQKEEPKYQTQLIGWYPHWLGDFYKDINYAQLTSLCYFAGQAEINSNLDITYNTRNWASKEISSMIAMADDASCNVLYAFQFQNKEVAEEIFNNEDVGYFCTQFLIEQITDVQNVTGVNIIFDSNTPFQCQDSITSFLANLSSELKKIKKNLVLTFPATAYEERLDFASLDTLADQVVLLGYNYYYKNSAKAGPIAPLESGEKWGRKNLKNTLIDYLNLGISKQKIVMALPYYGAVWQLQTDKQTFVKPLRYSEILNLTNGATPLYDTIAQTAYYNYIEKDKSYVCYFDDPSTLKEKYRWFAQQGIAGIGMWALGYDHGSDHMTNMINDNFTTIKNLKFKREVLTDSIPLGSYSLTNLGSSSVLLDIQEDINQLDFSIFYSQKEIVIVFALTFISFLLLGTLTALFSPVIYERLLISSLSQYLKIMFSFLSLLLFCFIITNYIFENEASSLLNTYLGRIGIFGIIIIHILSWKTIFRFNKELP